MGPPRAAGRVPGAPSRGAPRPLLRRGRAVPHRLRPCSGGLHLHQGQLRECGPCLSGGLPAPTQRPPPPTSRPAVLGEHPLCQAVSSLPKCLVVERGPPYVRFDWALPVTSIQALARPPDPRTLILNGQLPRLPTPCRREGVPEEESSQPSPAAGVSWRGAEAEGGWHPETDLLPGLHRRFAVPRWGPFALADPPPLQNSENHIFVFS